MNPKRIITIALLVFVLASVAYLVATEARKPSTDTADSAVQQSGPQRQVIAYYFHGNVRCPTCRKIEAYASESIEGAFSDELKSGKLQWRALNIEEPANEHFIADYQLTTRSLVLADMDGTTQRQWKNLDRVWELVGDKPSFVRYVQDEVRAYLAESN